MLGFIDAMNSMRVVIVEDQVLFRQLLRKLCIEDLDCTVVGEVGTATEAVVIIDETKPDVLILDLHLAAGDGFDLIRYVQTSGLATKILVVSAHSDLLTVGRLGTMNIAGFVEKNTGSLVTVMLALAAIRSGETFFCEGYKRAQFDGLRAKPAPLGRFSPRELQVLALIGEAASDSEIGSSLGISRTTAQTYRSQIMRKVGVTSTPKLMRFALESGITKLGPATVAR